MPFKAERISSGPDEGKFQVINTETGEVKARGTTKDKAQSQARLLNAIEFNPSFVPRGSKKNVSERETLTEALSDYFQVNIDEARKKKPKKGDPGYKG